MGKLNTPSPRGTGAKLRARSDAAENYEGGLAFSASPENELYTRVATCMWEEPKFYDAPANGLSDTGEAIIGLAHEVDPVYVLNLAVYARDTLNLRTVPQVLLVEVANREDLKGADKTFVREAAARIIRRADELCEVLAYQIAKFGKPIPNCIRNAVADRLNRLSEYEAFKYRGAGRNIALHDALNIVHPTPPTNEQNAIFAWLTGNEVDWELVPKLHARQQLMALDEFGPEAIALAEKCDATWEDMVSKFGNVREVWEASSLPYMALLRNLRNLVEAGCDMRPYAERIADAEEVRKSRQFPYRFLSAYRSLMYEQEYGYLRQSDLNVPQYLYDAIYQALSLSAENMPRLGGMTAIFCDNSGSMANPVSSKSVISRMDVGHLFGAIASKCCENSLVGVFGETYATVPMRHDTMDNIHRLGQTDVGHSTEGHLTVRHLRENNINVDRIILFSDLQLYSRLCPYYDGGSLYEQLLLYRKHVNPDVRLVSIDLAGYGTLQCPANDPLTLTAAGWNESVFSYIPIWESGGGGAVEMLKTQRLF